MQHVEIFEIWKHSIAFHSIPQIISGLSSAKGEVADDLNAIQHHLSQTILSIASQVAALHLHHPAISNRSCKDHWRANLFVVRCPDRIWRRFWGLQHVKANAALGVTSFAANINIKDLFFGLCSVSFVFPFVSILFLGLLQYGAPNNSWAGEHNSNYHGVWYST